MAHLELLIIRRGRHVGSCVVAQDERLRRKHDMPAHYVVFTPEGSSAQNLLCVESNNYHNIYHTLLRIRGASREDDLQLATVSLASVDEAKIYVRKLRDTVAALNHKLSAKLGLEPTELTVGDVEVFLAK